MLPTVNWRFTNAGDDSVSWNDCVANISGYFAPASSVDKIADSADTLHFFGREGAF